MTLERLVQIADKALPLITQWIDETLAAHAEVARPVAALDFDRISDYFAPTFLGQTHVVVAHEVPFPPFRALDLDEFADLAEGPAVAVTYRDTYFIQPDCAGEEAIHFHELVHAIQWAELGVDGFLLAYAHGLLTAGYLESPLEVQASSHEQRFRANEGPYDVSAAVTSELRALGSQFPDLDLGPA